MEKGYEKFFSSDDPDPAKSQSFIDFAESQDLPRDGWVYVIEKWRPKGSQFTVGDDIISNNYWYHPDDPYTTFWHIRD